MDTIMTALAAAALWFAGFVHGASWPYRVPQPPDDATPTVEYLCHQTQVAGLRVDRTEETEGVPLFYDTRDFILRRVRPTDRRPRGALMVQPGESWVAFDESMPQGLVSGTEGYDSHVRLDGGGTNISVDLGTGRFIRASMGLTESPDGRVDFLLVPDPRFSVGRCIPQVPTSTYPHAPSY